MDINLGVNFFEAGSMHACFVQLMKRLSQKDEWFAPVGTLLDHLFQIRGPRDIAPAERRRREWRWLGHELRTGTTL
jgi:hypothetical protein